MRIDDLELVKNDVIAFLNDYSNQAQIKFIFLERRYFSEIYEIQCSSENNTCNYILKISTTNRSCKNEFEQYVYLNKNGIRSLEAIYFSEKYNYLITKKENLVSFDKRLNNCRNIAERKKYFYKFGQLFKDIDLKTGTSVRFKEHEFKDYVIPRINSLEKLNDKEKALLINKIEFLSSRLRNQGIRECFVSDFSLENIHLNNKGDIVLVDMGDATIGNNYDNISFIFLITKFGPLTQYFDFNNNSYQYFASFLKGYEIDFINDDLFTLFKIKHLVNMISFISDLNTGSKNLIHKLPALISNAYLTSRYKQYLLRIVNIR